MATITTRSGKGLPLTNNEVDSNFTNLNTDKVEKSGDTLTGNLNFGDSNKIQLGASNDLQIFHDGSNSYVKDAGQGYLILGGQDTGVAVQNSAGQNLILTSANAVTIAHGNTARLATTSSGIEVTGGIAATDDSTFTASSGNIFVTTQTVGAGRSGFRVDETSTNGFEMVHDNADNAFFISRRSGNATVKDALKIDRSTGDFSLFEDTGTTPKFFWDASTERLGLGTVNPGATLDVDGTLDIAPSSGDAALKILNSQNYGRSLVYFSDPDGTGGRILYNHGSDYMSFETDGTNERMRIDSVGNVLISGTEKNPAQNNTTDAISLHSAGLLRASTTNAAAPLDLNVKSREGDIATFRKDGTLVGSLGAKDGDIYIGTGDTQLRFSDGADDIRPASTDGAGRDAAIDLGTTANRFKDLHLSGTANTGGLDVDGSIKLDGNYPTGSNNVALGNNALNSVTTGGNNVFIGNNAGTGITTGNYNTAAGSLALDTSQTADYNTAFGASALRATTTGEFNVAVGTFALQENTTGEDSVAVGYYALRSSSTTTGNVGVGYRALTQLTFGLNVAIGKDAMRLATTANQNTAVGSTALDALTTGTYNVSLGHSSLTKATTAQMNVGIGVAALNELTTASGNVALGHNAAKNVTSSNNVAIGKQAMQNSTSGTQNVAIGAFALDASNTGSYHTAVGYGTLGANTSGASNTALGYYALNANTSASNNTAVGYFALGSSTTAGSNVAIGQNALASTVTGGSNVAVGRQALYANTATSNTGVGYQALYANTSGESNTSLGFKALDAITTQSKNTAIGTDSASNKTAGDRGIYIGVQAGRADNGDDNIAIGEETLRSNSSGADRNIAMGHDALYNLNTTGSTYNIGIGYHAGRSITTATNATLLGGLAGDSITTGGNNTMLGYNSGSAVTTGYNNTFAGQGAGSTITTGHDNTIIGRYNGNQGGLDIRTSNNHIVLSDGDGNPRVVVDSSGNTGIGTVSPQQKLDITSAGTQRIQIKNTNLTSSGFYVAEDSTGAQLNELGAYPMRFHINGSERARFDASGNFLVGATSAHGEKVRIKGTASDSDSTVLRLQQSSANAGATNLIKMGVEGGSFSKGAFGWKRLASYDRGAFIFAAEATTDSSDVTSSDEIMRIKYDGKVSIGTTADTSTLNIQAGAPSVRFYDSNLTTRQMEINAENGNAIIKVDPNQTEGTSYFAVEVDASEAMRIDSSGNLLVGKTASGGNTAGFEVRSDGDTLISRDSNRALFLNRKTSDGNILDFAKDGTTVGKIGISNNDIYIGTGDTSLTFVDGSDTINPTGANGAQRSDTVSLGDANNRFKDLYLSGTARGTNLDFTGTVEADTTLLTRNKLQINNGRLFEFLGASTHLAIKDSSAGTERMRLDSSGNLLVGKASAAGASTLGIEVRPNGDLISTRSGNAALTLNRKTSDGTIAQFRKDNTTVGSIGSVGGSALFINSIGTGKLKANGSDRYAWDASQFYPTDDNLRDLGFSTFRWDDVYATNGTINTSDRNEKQDIEALSDAEQRVAVACKGLLRKFRWRSSVADKGDEARIHFGIIAQDLQAAFEAEGLDAGRYAMFINSTWTDEETGEERSRMGVRYSELLAFIIAGI